MPVGYNFPDHIRQYVCRDQKSSRKSGIALPEYPRIYSFSFHFLNKDRGSMFITQRMPFAAGPTWIVERFPTPGSITIILMPLICSSCYSWSRNIFRIILVTSAFSTKSSSLQSEFSSFSLWSDTKSNWIWRRNLTIAFWAKLSWLPVNRHWGIHSNRDRYWRRV